MPSHGVQTPSTNLQHENPPQWLPGRGRLGRHVPKLLGAGPVPVLEVGPGDTGVTAA